MTLDAEEFIGDDDLPERDTAVVRRHRRVEKDLEAATP